MPRADWEGVCFGSPEIEVRQNNGQFIVRKDLPGLKKDDVKVELTDNLTDDLRGKTEENEEKREGYYRSERSNVVSIAKVPLPESAKTVTAIAYGSWECRARWQGAAANEVPV